MKQSILVLAALTLACSEPDTANVLDPSLSSAYPCVEQAAGYESPDEGIYTIDERFADIARRTPGGFGGFFLEDGAGRAWLVDASKTDDARAVLSAEFGIRNIEFLQGQYDWLQLISCYRVLQAGGIWQTNVNGSDIQESLNRIVLMVPDRARDELAVRELIRELQVPQAMVVFEEGELVFGAGSR